MTCKSFGFLAPSGQEVRGIACGRSERKWRCFCGLAGGYQCDWILGDRKAEKPAHCDRHLCPDHAFQIGLNKHVCPEHREVWEAFEKTIERRLDYFNRLAIGLLLTVIGLMAAGILNLIISK